MKKCPKCGNITDSKFCPECGTDLSAVDVLKACPKCGKETNSKFCPECGTEVKPVSGVKKKTKTEKKKTDSDEVTKVAEPTVEAATEIEPTVEVATEVKPTVEAMPAATTVEATKEKPKNKKTLKIVAIAAGVILLLLIGAGLGSGGSNSGTSDSSSTTTTEETTEETTVEETTPEEPEETNTGSVFGEFTTEEDYESLNYDDLARTPDEYKGKKYTGSGKVLQVMEGDGEVHLRIAIDGDYDNVVYAVYDSSIVDSRVLEDDYVTFYGESEGLYTYTSTMGGEITIPMMFVQKISVD